jgi:pimeloyl-ACP methyl ester carboxylesterase
MGTIKVDDGREIFFKDWGTGQPIVFHHGWPLSGDEWDTQLLLDKGYRVVAHDRRGHGRSSPSSPGNDMETYAADVAALVSHLDLTDATDIGHSTGGLEATRYVASYGNGGGRRGAGDLPGIGRTGRVHAGARPARGSGTAAPSGRAPSMTPSTPYELVAPSRWAQPPKQFNFSSLQAVAACPRRWQLPHSEWGTFSRFPERAHPR